MNWGKIFAWCACFVIFFSCAQHHDIPFQFHSHQVKIKIDPHTLSYSATDTISLSFHKKHDRLFFFIEESMTIERIGIGQQDLSFNVFRESDIEKNLRPYRCPREYCQNKKLVNVLIPPNLHPKQIAIWYDGSLASNLSQNDNHLWYPVLMDSLTTFKVTALTPCDYQVTSTATCYREAVNKKWRISLWEEKSPCHFLPLYVEPSRGNSSFNTLHKS